jgi:hypothetical protein
MTTGTRIVPRTKSVIVGLHRNPISQNYTARGIITSCVSNKSTIVNLKSKITFIFMLFIVKKGFFVDFFDRRMSGTHTFVESFLVIK